MNRSTPGSLGDAGQRSRLREGSCICTHTLKLKKNDFEVKILNLGEGSYPHRIGGNTYYEISYEYYPMAAGS